MENTIKTNNDEIKVRDDSGSISEVTEKLLLDLRSSIENKKTISVPIGKLSSLGAGVSSLIPALHTVTTTTTFSTTTRIRSAPWTTHNRFMHSTSSLRSVSSSSTSLRVRSSCRAMLTTTTSTTPFHTAISSVSTHSPNHAQIEV